jgi:predicted ATP-binding protein involved in virulence
MKIKKVKWLSHPILGSLELDFINPTTNRPFDTILFAGENGTGKTIVLESISTFLNMGSFEYFEYLEYIVNGQIYKAVPQTEMTSHKMFFNIINPDGTARKIRSDKSNNRELIVTDILDVRHYGCVFSKARADYKTQQIQSTTTKKLDIDKYDVDNEDNFTSLKQLIVDVENQDNSDYAETNKSLGITPKPWGDFYLTSKIYRFKSAFEAFFDTLEYDKVTDLGSEKAILFMKNGKSIAIDNLSTGEKQIVFRGIYLLKNGKNLAGAAVMVDEPELSMHPKWEQNILKYYKDLFTESGLQKTQLFFASHSEHVLKEALVNKNDNLVIVLNDVQGTIVTKRVDAPTILPSITAAEVNYLAFDIISNDFHIELFGWLQDKESKSGVKSCDDFIKAHSLYNPLKHGKHSSHNATTYDTLSTFIRNAIHHPDPSRTFTDTELRTSIELLVELCK